MLATKKRRAKRYTHKEWQQFIHTWEQSGQGQRAFCREHGLGYSTFCKWRRRLSGTRPSAEPKLIELTPPVARVADWDVELELGSGMVLRLRHR